MYLGLRATYLLVNVKISMVHVNKSESTGT